MDKRLAPVAFAAPAVFAAAEEGGPRKFSGIAYAGGVVTDHPLYDRVAFDIASTKLATPAWALLEHSKRVGKITSATLDGQIAIDGALFSDMGGDAKEITDMADRGAPWQLSVRIYPAKVEEIKAGNSIELNGQTMAGPLTVFRNNRVREVSFCALGADDQTSAQIFTVSEGGSRAAPLKDPAMSENTIDRAEHDRIVAEFQVRLDAAGAAGKAATDRVTALETEFAASKLAVRTTAVKTLFTAIGREYKDAEAAPYLTMDEAVFAVVANDLRAARPRIDPKLTMVQATDGVSGDDAPKLRTTQQIQAAAMAHISEQAKLGITVSSTDAVLFVSKAA